jgi:tetratricopeptide (TPR) repeat protein
MTRVPLHFLSALFVVLGGSAAAQHADTPSIRPFDGAQDRPEILVLDDRYERRAEPGNLDQVIVAAQRLVHEDSTDFEAMWRLARAFSWRGYTSSKVLQRKKAAERAMKIGERAITLAPNRVEGHFTYAIATGVYADAIGVTQAFLRRVGHDFERAMTRAYELDKHFDDGSPMVALGRYYYSLPWPLRDLERSARLLEEAIAAHPRSLRGHLYLAETYYDLKRPADARRELEIVVRTASTDAGAAALVKTANDDLTRWFGEPLFASAPNEEGG